MLYFYMMRRYKGSSAAYIPKHRLFGSGSMVSAEDVKKIAKLAALSITPEEVERFTRELNAIFAHVETLRSIDVSSVEAMSHVHGSINVFREDKVSGQMDTEAALSNVPDRSGRFIRVPIIIAQ